MPTLAHWDRDSFSHAPLTETVGESQAYEDMWKVVLVEGKRIRAVKETVQRVLQLNGGMWRERVDFWDWRVLEECAAHSVGPTDMDRKHFLDATMFYDKGEDGQRSAFVSSVHWPGFRV